MTNISVTEQISVITFGNIPAENETEFLHRLFSAAAREDVNIDMISKAPSSSETTNFGFTFDDEDMPKILQIANALPYDVTPMVSCGNIKVVINSADMVDTVGFAEKVFFALSETNTIPALITTALDEISVVVRESDYIDFTAKLKKIFNV